MLTADTFIINNFSRSPEIHQGYAKVMLPYTGQNLFHSILGVDKENRVIHNSNSFLVDPNGEFSNLPGLNSYDSRHTIFTRLNDTYYKLKDDSPSERVKEPMFLLANPFSATNFGHDLSILFDRISYYRSQRLTRSVVVSETIPRSLEICRMLLPNTPFYFLSNNKIVEFDDLLIGHNEIFHINKHSNLKEEVINKSLSSLTHSEQKYMGRKIFIVKNNSNKNIISSHTSFICDKTIDVLVNDYDFVCINPETMPIEEIVTYLIQASKIITSFGAISYGNGIFFNRNSQNFILNATAYYDQDIVRPVHLPDPPYNIDANLDFFLSAIGEK